MLATYVLFTIILPWVNYGYKHLPMKVNNSQGNFQDKTNEMFCGFEFIQACIDDLLKITKGHWSDYSDILELTLKNLKYKGLKCNIEFLFFRQTKK